MSWIDTKMSLPLKEGKYSCLIDVDGLGTLEPFKNQYFNGKDWDHYGSSRQFIRYWEASEEEYKIISDYWEIEQDKYFTELGEQANNFGGI